ncbi:MAG: histidine phosphatase family protein [Anaerolineae bacterium]
MALDLILVRHGQSQYNVDQTGGEDAPLTELGRMQARRVGAYLAARFEIAALYASTYIRARETAETINRFIGLELVLDPDLREANQDFAGGLKLFTDPLASFESHPAFRPQDISEYYAGFQARVIGALQRILRNHDTGQVAIVSHGGVMATIIRSLTGSHQFSVHTENTGIHLLRWENHRWHVGALNRVEHLLSEQDLVTIPEMHEHKRE